jgi:hypothetical protein
LTGSRRGFQSSAGGRATPTSRHEETDLTIGPQPQSHGQTPSQLAHAEVRLTKVAFEKATRIAQERSQKEAQEVKRKKQEATADSKKSKKAGWYRATMDKLEKLPPCPKLCMGEECSGIPCKEEEPGFSYSHIDNIVVCKDKANMSMATRDGCLMFHLWMKRLPKPPAPPAGPLAGRLAKNSGGEPRAQGSSSLEGSSSSSATSTTGG